MISFRINCAQAWVRLVRLWCRITRRPQVTYDAPPMPTSSPRTSPT